ncbi:hypothetical protein os4_37280 (plasmid) [Comamonadaceae bacterium OS-4]|nr:hypothetical protein os4_37280 [Comamonadaceae bacterium OS-4]
MQKTSPASAARLVAPIHSERSPAPEDVWDHRAYSTWRNEIWKLIEDFVDADVKKAFLECPPKYVVGDDLSWLDDIVYAVRNDEIDSKALLAERLRSSYRALRAVHGTRTDNIPKFYHDGLLPMVPELLHAQAREIFLGGEFPELTESMLLNAIEAVGSELREGRVWFEANEEMLIAQAGHYMLYGSEYVTAIAAHLQGYRDYRQVLKNSGQPTMFVCDVPLELINEGILKEFAGGALESVFQELLDGPEFVPDRWRGAGFYIRKPLSAEHLVGHYHPNVRRDPLR